MGRIKVACLATRLNETLFMINFQLSEGLDRNIFKFRIFGSAMCARNFQLQEAFVVCLKSKVF
jgi:hypothetical protein